MLPKNDSSPARILIVDDQQTNIRLLEHTLRRAGFEDATSTTDPQAVAGLHLENEYDLILLDLQMPEMSGLEVLRGLQEIRRAHPVLILVISADPAQMATALAEGADGFLGKPFRLPDVVDHVKLLLDRPSKE
ncbi:MAG: response regulator [Acidobacteria bacterium]|nr:response regulator [Acidobacteriota bacterium]